MDDLVGVPLLAGVRVLDLTTGIAGPVATLLLAEAGADVVKLEPPANPDRERPGFRTWNRSKRSVELDLATDEGRHRLEALLGAADVLVHELGPTAAANLDLDDAALAERHPGLVVSSVLSWPANHPLADSPVDELLAMARMGILDEQFAMRREGPVYIRFALGGWCAGYLAAIGVLARLHARGAVGTGGPAHTSLVQGALVPMGMHWSRAERPSAVLAEGMTKASRGSQNSLFECGDGAWFHLMGNPMLSPTIAERLGAGADLAAVLAERGRDEVLADLWAHDVPAQPCLPFGAALEDEQARANGYVVDVDDPESGRVTMAGNPLSTSPPCTVRWPAPELGQHTAAVVDEWAAVPPRGPVAAGGSSRWPLEGLRVLDLGAYLAGPYGPMLLADLGAEVIKVEPTTGDGMRPVEWAFAGCQRGKRSVALDLKSSEARPALEALIGWADVVHHNLRMPAARRLGLGVDDVHRINPRAVYCHTSSYGPVGERADWPGFDQLFQAACGWEVLGAGEGNPPMWHRFGFMDHLCAMASVVATLLALRRRTETGEGQQVAASLLGTGVLTNGEVVVRSDGSLTPFVGLDAEQLGVSDRRRIVEVTDGWVALAADGAASGARLPTDLAGGTVAEALDRLAAAGVPAEAVRLDQRDAFLDDAANRAAGLVATYEHGDWGRLDQTGGLWDFGDLALRIERPPSRLGEHTVEVLTELGLDAAAIDALLRSGAAVDLGR